MEGIWSDCFNRCQAMRGLFTGESPTKDLYTIIKSAKKFFMKEIITSNERFRWHNCLESLLLLLRRVDTLAAIALIGMSTSFILSNDNNASKSRTVLLCAEVAAVSMVFLPYFLPFKEVRFFYGLIVFATGMSIHSRVCNALYQLRKGKGEAKIEGIAIPATNASEHQTCNGEVQVLPGTAADIAHAAVSASAKRGSDDNNVQFTTISTADNTTASPGTPIGKVRVSSVQVPQNSIDPEKVGSLACSPSAGLGAVKSSFLLELFNTHYFNLLPRIHHFRQPRPPSSPRLLHWMTIGFLVDCCMYIIKEWIPANINPENQLLAESVVGGVWVLFSMDMVYCSIISTMDVLGAPLPLEMRHKHPLLSCSLSEFWGVRWNPVIGKQLQDSFYKPLRRLGVSRTLCVVGCFTGSAFLHAVPQYASTRDWTDCAMMFAFFFLQGVCLLLELAVRRLCGWDVHSRNAPPPAGTVTPVSSHTDLTALTQESVSDTGVGEEGRPEGVEREEGGDEQKPVAVQRSKMSRKQRQQQWQADREKELKEQQERQQLLLRQEQTSREATVQKKQAHANDLSGASKAVSFQFPAELLLIGFIFSTFYSAFEGGWTWVSCAVTASFGAGAVAFYWVVRQQIEDVNAHSLQRSGLVQRVPGSLAGCMRTFCWTLVGWIWTVGIIVLMLPLFALPVLHACDTLYRGSIVVGPLVRTATALVAEYC